MPAELPCSSSQRPARTLGAWRCQIIASASTTLLHKRSRPQTIDTLTTLSCRHQHLQAISVNILRATTQMVATRLVTAAPEIALRNGADSLGLAALLKGMVLGKQNLGRLARAAPEALQQLAQQLPQERASC